MEDRTLAALGLDVVPREHPLEYPGAWPRESGLLDGDRLLPLDRWVFEDRVPVISIGSNACPAQLRHKLADSGITFPLPMVRALVTGVGIGVSAHVSLMGYVSNSPVATPGRVSELFVLWLDARQLTVIDASEGVPLPHGNFRRAWLPAPDVRIELPDGGTLPGAYAYVNRRGVLHDGTGTPPHPPGPTPPADKPPGDPPPPAGPVRHHTGNLLRPGPRGPRTLREGDTAVQGGGAGDRREPGAVRDHDRGRPEGRPARCIALRRMRRRLRRRVVGFVPQQISRLALQYLAQRGECREPDRLRPAVLQDGQVRRGDADAFG